MFRVTGNPVYIGNVTPLSEYCEVWLDGVRRPMCLRAHAWEGWATSYVEDDKGGIDRDIFGRPKEVVEYGSVEIRLCF